MTIKELKEKIKNLPDDAEVIIDYRYIDGDPGWTREEEEEHKVEDTTFFDWSSISCPSEFHISTYKEN